jgi:hypothetical protein
VEGGTVRLVSIGLTIVSALLIIGEVHGAAYSTTQAGSQQWNYSARDKVAETCAVPERCFTNGHWNGACVCDQCAKKMGVC